jgi:hypothetical protein
MLAAEHAREAQVKCGKISQNRDRWTAPIDFGDQASPGPAKCRQLVHDFHDAKHANVGSVDNRIHAGFSHPGPTHAKQVDVGSPAERHGQPRRIHIAGGFAGRD